MILPRVPTRPALGVLGPSHGSVKLRRNRYLRARSCVSPSPPSPPPPVWRAFPRLLQGGVGGDSSVFHFAERLSPEARRPRPSPRPAAAQRHPCRVPQGPRPRFAALCPCVACITTRDPGLLCLTLQRPSCLSAGKPRQVPLAPSHAALCPRTAGAALPSAAAGTRRPPSDTYLTHSSAWVSVFGPLNSMTTFLIFGNCIWLPFRKGWRRPAGLVPNSWIVLNL